MSSVVEQAILVGKFPESRRAHYERLYTRDPAGTKRLIATLEPVPGLKAPARRASSPRGIIRSSAGLPLRPHPRGGYYVERS